jgi:GTP-binding protein
LDRADEFYRSGEDCARRPENRAKAICSTRSPSAAPAAAEDEPPMSRDEGGDVGRRNTGKSTLVNTLAKAERMIVSEVPGTTRDSVDVRFDLDGKSFLAIDTPGFRRNKSINTDVDFYSTHRAQRSIRRADVVLLFFDATQRISKVDKQLCDYIAQQYKPCIFVVNKWDVTSGAMPRRQVSHTRHVPGDVARSDRVRDRSIRQRRQDALEPRLDAFQTSAQLRVVAEINRLVKRGRGAGTTHHRATVPQPAKIYCATRAAKSRPPTIILFCNNHAKSAASRTYQHLLVSLHDTLCAAAECPSNSTSANAKGGDARDGESRTVAQPGRGLIPFS